jgi:FtsP/CotA-like multicopper oxidase with cupredoxin domain
MQLVSLPFSDFSGGGMMGGMMGGSSLPNGAPLDILSLKIGEKGADVIPLPARLSTVERHNLKDAVNQNNPRSFTLAMQNMIHTINDRLFEMDAVAKDEIVRLGDLELWEFANLEGRGGGMGMGMMDIEMPHPMHIHGVLFQVLGRQITQGYESAYQELSAGFVDDGWKDTVLVMPGEKVQVLVRFEDYAGTFVYHCHNLEHGDAELQNRKLICYRLQEYRSLLCSRVHDIRHKPFGA